MSTSALDANRVQRVGDPVFCTRGCKSCRPYCPTGQIITGQRNFYVENQRVAVVGSRCSNCCAGCSCCPCPNFIQTGYYFNFFFFNQGVARKKDRVSNGYFMGGALRTFIGGIGR